MKRLLALIITLSMVFGTLAVCASAETPTVCLNPNYHLHITATGYYIDGEEETAFVGDYVLYGSGYRLYIESEGTYNVTLHEYEAMMGSGGVAVQFNASATLNLIVQGICLIKSNANNVIDANGNENCKVTLDIADNSSLTFDNYAWNDDYAVDPLIEFTMADGSEVPGTDVEGWNTNAFTVENGTPASHENSYFYVDDNTCANGCEGCGIVFSVQEHNAYYYPVEGGHQLICNYCDHAIGEVEAHDANGWYADGEICVNCCDICGYEHSAAEHSYIAIDVAATKYESAHTFEYCENCKWEQKEYDAENAIVIEMYDDYGDGWNGGWLAIVEKGIPVHYITMEDGSDTIYAIPYDEDNVYALKWFGGGLYPEEIGIAIYVPGEEEPVFEQYDMTDFGIEIIYSANLADYTEIDGLVEEIPDFLEEYTADSVNALVDVLKEVEYMLPASEQDGVDAVADALKEAIDGLVLAGEDDVHSRGVINKANGSTVWVYPDEYRYSNGEVYEHDGNFVIFGKSDEGIFFYEGVEAAVELVNLEIIGYDGCIGMYMASVEMSLFGENVLVVNSDDYAGIDMDSASLHILDSEGALIAVGSDDCAGIGSYCWYDEETGEPIGINAGDITIDGGNIYAFSMGDGAGIGGGYYGGFDTITINGGNIYAECIEDDGSGIGVGDDGYGGDIIINGGNITALSLDDDGAGIGGANYGYVESITINGGTIIVGSEDGAGIGGGQEGESYGGRITINGGLIMAHEDHNDDENLIGNGSSDSKDADEDNFVIITGGIILTKNSSGIYPAPTDAEGNPIESLDFNVNESLRDTTVTVKLSDGSDLDITADGVHIGLYSAGDIEVTNADALACDVNGDQLADMFDYLIVKRIYFEAYDYTDYEYLCGDVNGDDVVDMFDYLEVKTAYFKS